VWSGRQEYGHVVRSTLPKTATDRAVRVWLGRLSPRTETAYAEGIEGDRDAA